MDLVIRCQSLPKPGETQLARSSQEVPGGKGANQAVAASRAGGAVKMIGRVGDDAFAPKLLDNLRSERIDVSHVKTTARCASGIAVVAVEDRGENSILVVPGANGEVQREDILEIADLILVCDMVLVQFEIPFDTVRAVVQLARQADRPILLNPAPYHSDCDDSILGVDLLCPNQSEASMILGRSIVSVEDAKQGAKDLRMRGAKRVVITLGDQGAVLADEQGEAWIEPFAIKAVDTTAAGDAFCGALAVYCAEGMNFRDAVRFGCAAGALAATRLGAQPALPTRIEIDRMMK